MFPVKEIRKRSMVDADKANRTAARSPPSAGAPEADAAAKVLVIHGGRRPGRSGKAGRDGGGGHDKQEGSIGERSHL